MLEPPQPLLWAHSNGDRVPWLSQAPISIAWTSALSLLPSSVTFWPCHSSVPSLELAHSQHTPPTQSKPSPNPTPLFLGSGKTQSKPNKPWRIWTPGRCPTQAQGGSPQPIFSSSLAAPQGEETCSSLLTPGTRSSSF